MRPIDRMSKTELMKLASELMAERNAMEDKLAVVDKRASNVMAECEVMWRQLEEMQKRWKMKSRSG